ncbi:hypothetical protein EHQ46_11240 [Leptospira yanagawae]|uniref:Lipoprotein n=1 Tax=Leptospira yanagawae TaxID=293069 RepID=A0ABY2M358_9LEPT|nr:hypothetical protein [Leptospira yanagawae]TGL19960.1 hypothetical protein EHQ46_11240 [Leptospira yanagawae]
MKYGIVFTLSLTLFLSGCEKKDKDSYLWLFALLNSSPSELNSLPPEDPTPNPENNTPTKIHISIITASESKELCPNFGGIFIQYKKGSDTTCPVNNWAPSCVSYLYHPDGVIKMIDARSFVGLSFPDDLEIPSILFPSNHLSNMICFKQMIPPDNDHVNLYSFQVQAIKKNQFVCEGRWNETQCIDSFPIFGNAEFLMPKEFPILSSDGDGHAGSQTLKLKYISEDNLYTICTYFGNEHRKIEGFAWNAYIAGNGNLGEGLGSCSQCSSNYCEFIDPTSGQEIKQDPERMFPIPYGSIVSVKKEIVLHVNKGQGPGKHSVFWNLQGFQQWSNQSELLLLFSNSNVLFIFILPALITFLMFMKQYWKRKMKLKR